MKLFHVVTAKSKAEIEVILECRPPRILVSYHYFKNRSLEEFVETIGYRPEILLDSGAFSAWNSGKGIALTDYMNYLDVNREWVHRYFSLDVVTDPDLSFWYYQILRKKGYDPIPVYHYHAKEEYLQKYLDDGATYIGLGGTVPIKNKREVADWARMLVWQYPHIQFHLLGSSSMKIFETVDLYSADSSTYWMKAVNGQPHHIKGNSRKAKMERAAFNLRRELEVFSC